MKRKNQNDASSSQKRQRANSSPDAESPKKIIDLDDDCLEKIFSYLDFLSLVSVAVSNEYLRPAANLVYNRKFSNKIINIHGLNSNRTDEKLDFYIFICFEKVSFGELKTCLQFLRCFGSSLSNIHIYYEMSSNKRYKYVHRYINEYCAESLNEFEFIMKSRMTIDHFDKPFVNVHTVAVHSCHFGDQFPLFSRWFPNVRSFKLHNLLLTDGWIDSPFHHLEDVRIDVKNTGHDGFTKNETGHLLRSSHRLKRLKICLHIGRQGMTLNTLLNIIEDKPSIEMIFLLMSTYCWTVKSSELQRLVNEHPSLIEIDLRNYKFTVNNVLSLIGQLNFLQRFEFQLTNFSEYAHMVSRLDNGWQSTSRTNFHGNRNYIEVYRQNGN